MFFRSISPVHLLKMFWFFHSLSKVASSVTKKETNFTLKTDKIMLGVIARYSQNLHRCQADSLHAKQYNWAKQSVYAIFIARNAAAHSIIINRDVSLLCVQNNSFAKPQSKTERNIKYH